MFHLLRLVLTGAYLYFAYFLLHPADSKTEIWRAGLIVTELILLGIPVGCLWVPVIAGKMADFLFGSFTSETGGLETERDYARLNACHFRGWRRRALLLGIALYLLGDKKFSFPLVIALKNARPKSWLEKWLALQLFQFDHLENCVLAYTILKKNHGYTKAQHSNPDVARALLYFSKRDSPQLPRVKLPASPRRRKLKRNQNIKLGIAPEGRRPEGK